MKKQVLLVLTAGLVAGGLTATPASAADPAPAEVRISWKDDTHKFVRVTWDEPAGRPNKVFVRQKDRPDGRFQVRYVGADQPDVVDIAAADLAPYGSNHPVAPAAEIGVTTGTDAGETSPVAVSAPFDTIKPAIPSPVSYALSGGSTLTVKWQMVLPTTDTTPNDPLDLTGTERYSTAYSDRDGGPQIPLTPPGTGMQATFTGPTPSYIFRVTAHNEWGSFDAPVAYANKLAATIKTPAWVKSDTPQAVVSGTYNGVEAPVFLQARNTPTSAWYTVASQMFHSGSYSFALGAAGSRQYRVLIPNTFALSPSDHNVYFGGYSQVVSTTVQINAHASFVGEVKVGQTATAQLWLSPALVGKASLERWNGTKWTTVGPVPIANSSGRAYIRGVTPGRVAYRFYVPAGSIRGMSYAATYTPNFVLTTVR